MRSAISVISISVLSIILGAIASIAISLAAARWSSIGDARGGIILQDRGPAWKATAVAGLGIQRWHITRQEPYSLPQGAPERLEAPDWLRLPNGESRTYLSTMEVLGAGWPAICLRTDARFDIMNFSPTAKRWNEGYEIERGSTFQPFTSMVLPLSPIWAGLLINTGVFSAAWFSLFLAVSLGRTYMRRRRGRCVRCGYDLRGSAGPRCPECGGAIRSQNRCEHGVGQQKPAASEAHAAISPIEQS